MPGKLITIPLFRRSYQKLSDGELIELFRSRGDKEVISEFFNRYVHLIYSVCYPYFKSDDKTRDIVMEIFESLGEKIKKYEIHNFKSWLYRVSRNACLMSLRKEKKDVSLELIENHHSIIVENEPNLHPDNGESKKLQSLGTFLTRLKKDQRLCIELMYFKDMSYKDISSATGYSLKQVKSYIQNGKRNLRGFFDKEVFE
jgi:RNA polymerase sigma-70 factor (ECF subfamily)